MRSYYDQTPVIPELDLSKVKPGTRAQFWVHLVSNGIARPIFVPIMVAKGLGEGPTLGVTAAVHGNELNGVPIVHQLFASTDPEKLSGTLVGVPVLNVPSFLRHERVFSDGIDLNRIFPGKRTGDTSQVYAHRVLYRIINRFEYLLDLHTASEGRINSHYIRADLDNPVVAKLAGLQNAEIVVHNRGADGTLRYAASELGIKTLTVELGDPGLFQSEMIDNGLTGIKNVMVHLGMIEDTIVPPTAAPVICERSFWIYTQSGGILEVKPELFEKVEKDDLIATVHNIFGERKQVYLAPENGIIIGKSIDPVNQTGSRILHLGVITKARHVR